MGRARALLLAPLLGLLLAAPLAAAELPQGVPPSPAEPVTDLAGLLSPGATQALNQALRAQWQAGHFQLAILTLPGLEGRPIEDVGIHVARTWGLGGKDTDNGVLLVVAMNDRKLRIEVGQKLEGRLTDIACSRIINDVMKPSLRAGDYDRAVLDAAAAITAKVAPDDPLAARAPKAADPTAGLSGPMLWLVLLLGWLIGHPFALIIAIFALQIGVQVFFRSAGIRPRGGGGRGGWGGGFGGGGFGGGGFGGGGGGGFGGGGGGFSGGGSSGGW